MQRFYPIYPIQPLLYLMTLKSQQEQGFLHRCREVTIAWHTVEGEHSWKLSNPIFQVRGKDTMPATSFLKQFLATMQPTKWHSPTESQQHLEVYFIITFLVSEKKLWTAHGSVFPSTRATSNNKVTSSSYASICILQRRWKWTKRLRYCR